MRVAEQGDEDGDADRRAELAGHPEDRGPGREALGGSAAVTAAGSAPSTIPTPAPPSMKPGRKVLAYSGVGADAGEDEGEAGGEDEAAGGGDRALSDAAAEPARGDREDRRHQRAGERAKPAFSAE